MHLRLRRRLALAIGMTLAFTTTTVAAAAAAPWSTSTPTLRGRVAFTANFTGGEGDWQVYTMTAEGRDVRQVTHLKESKDNALSASWSPDGTKLIFSSSVAGNGDIYVINADGTGQRRITSSSSDELVPAWSPTGKQIAFARSTSDGGAAIWTMNADGTAQRLAASDGFLPTFTRDGRHILYLSSEGGLVGAVWIMDTDGSNRRRITPAWLEAIPLDVSPDGRHVLMADHVNTALPVGLWSMNLDGSGLRRVTRAGCCYHDGGARYSPDGRNIEFVTDRWFAPRGQRQNEIWAMTSSGKGLHAVTSSITVGGCPQDLVDNCNGLISWHR